jgi:hypothetical protein
MCIPDVVGDEVVELPAVIFAKQLEVVRVNDLRFETKEKIDINMNIGI